MREVRSRSGHKPFGEMQEELQTREQAPLYPEVVVDGPLYLCSGEQAEVIRTPLEVSSWTNDGRRYQLRYPGDYEAVVVHEASIKVLRFSCWKGVVERVF